MMGFSLGIRIGRRRAVGSIPFSQLWETGGYWDLSEGSEYPLTSDIQSKVGTANLIPVNSPTTQSRGLGGRKVAKCTAAATQHFTADDVASLASGDDTSWSVHVRVRADDLTVLGHLFSFANSAGATDNYIRVGWNNTGFFIKKKAPSESELLLQDTNLEVKYDDLVVSVVANGTTYSIYYDGVLSTSGTLDAASITCNRFLLGARLIAGAVEPLDCVVQTVAVTATAMTASQVATLAANWRSKDVLASNPPQICYAGDSHTQGLDSQNFGSFRNRLQRRFIELGLSLDSVGNNYTGSLPDNDHLALGGTTINQIQTRIETYLGSGNQFPAVTAATLIGGTNDLALGDSVATALSDYTACLAALQSRLGPGGRILVSTIPDANPAATPTWQPNIAGFNSGLTSIWDAHDSANPDNKVFRADLFSVVGAYDAANYRPSDNVHPSNEKMTEFAEACLICTEDGGSETWEEWLTSVSPTSDTSAPTVQSAATNVDGDVITLVYSEDLRTAPTAGQYTLNSTSAVVSAVTIDGPLIELAVSPTVAFGETPTLDYATTPNALSDLAGNAAAALSGYAVVNNAASATMSSIFGANLRSAYLNENMAGSGGVVTGWTDTGSIAANLLAPGSVTYSASGGPNGTRVAQFPGSSADNLYTTWSGVTIAQPFCWVMIVRCDAWVNTKWIVADVTHTQGIVALRGVTPQFSQYGGTAYANANGAQAVSSWGLLIADFEGATSFIECGGSNVATGNPGTGSLGGAGSSQIRVGGYTSFSGQVSLAELCLLDARPTAGQITQLRSYVADKFGAISGT